MSNSDNVRNVYVYSNGGQKLGMVYALQNTFNTYHYIRSINHAVNI